MYTHIISVKDSLKLFFIIFSFPSLRSLVFISFFCVCFFPLFTLEFFLILFCLHISLQLYFLCCIRIEWHQIGAILFIELEEFLFCFFVIKTSDILGHVYILLIHFFLWVLWSVLGHIYLCVIYIELKKMYYLYKKLRLVYT